MSEINNTHKKGSRPIDSVTASPGIMSCIEGCSLVEVNEIILLDQRRYIFNVNFELYFFEQMSSWDTINRRIIDPSRRSHREKFCKSVESLIDKTGIIGSIQLFGNKPTWE